MEIIENGKYYHIFGRGTNKQSIFRDNEDCKNFLELLSIFIEPISEIYAYAIMKNHFHLALKIKEDSEIGYFNSEKVNSSDILEKWRVYHNIPNKEKSNFTGKPNINRMFQHFFSTYSKRFNIKYNQTGSAFEHPFKRIYIENESYLKMLILYIHNNPVKHGFCIRAQEYPWTSYQTIIRDKPTKLKREIVLKYFEDIDNFIYLHNEDYEDFSHLLYE